MSPMNLRYLEIRAQSARISKARANILTNLDHTVMTCTRCSTPTTTAMLYSVHVVVLELWLSVMWSMDRY